MSDNEHTAASLGHSEVLRVKHPPRQTVPEFGQCGDNDAEISPIGRTEESWDIFDKYPTRGKSACDSGELKEQGAPLSSQSLTASSHGEVLTWEPTAKKVNWGELIGVDRGDVVISRHSRPVPFEYLITELIIFHLPADLPPGALEAEVESANTGKQRTNGSHH
jgi:hypothetical protein